LSSGHGDSPQDEDAEAQQRRDESEALPVEFQYPDADDDAMGELLEVTREQARGEEDIRGALNARAGWLLGFAGVILTLAGAQAQRVLNESTLLGSVDLPLAYSFLAIAVLAVGGAALCSLQVLRLRRGEQISTQQLRNLEKSPLIKGPRAAVRGRAMNTLVDQIAKDRDANDTRRKWLRGATSSLAIAAIALVFHVGVYVARASEEPCIGRGSSAQTIPVDHSTQGPSNTHVAFASISPVAAERASNRTRTVTTARPADTGFGCFGKEPTEK
jgi:hypothetical protein